MQFYAFDEKKRVIHANRAKKNFNYTCIECQTNVRLRGGTHRRLHYFHIEPTRSCALHQKGASHLQLQTFLAENLPKDDCRLEYRFPAINRIADVAWLSKNIIFEIQCSPISPGEISRRNLDYLSQGWKVVWILHDQRYNQKYLSPAEIFLQDHPHYFSNMNAKGEGIIYDQFEIVENGIRIVKMDKLPVDLSCLFPIDKFDIKDTALSVCMKRIKRWPNYFGGDLMDINEHLYYQTALELEKKHFQAQLKRSFAEKGWRFLDLLIFQPYRVLFHYLLEKACR